MTLLSHSLSQSSDCSNKHHYTKFISGFRSVKQLLTIGCTGGNSCKPFKSLFFVLTPFPFRAVIIKILVCGCAVNWDTDVIQKGDYSNNDVNFGKQHRLLVLKPTIPTVHIIL